MLVVAVLAAGTILEKYYGSQWVADHWYGSWWFALLLTTVAAAAVWAIFKRRLWHKPASLLLHASIPVILLGGGLTTWTGMHGTMTLTPGIETTCYQTDGEEHTLPFAIALENFEIVPYEGTHAPMDFVSHIRCEGERFDISMNHIYRHRGYRFYQADYDEEGRSTLSVAHDPWGIAVTYTGYLLLLLGLGGQIVKKSKSRKDKKSEGRKAEKSKSRRVKPIFNFQLSIFTFLLLLLPVAAQAAPRTLPRETADQMGRIFVLYKDRICPLQTYAKDFTTKLTGKATWQGYSAEQVLAGFLYYFGDWANEPLIKVKGDPVRHQIGGGSWASYMQLSYLDGQPLGPTADKNIRAAAEKRNLVKSLISGRGLKIFPLADSTGTISWYSQNDQLPLTVGDDEYLFIRKHQSYCQELVLAGDFEALKQLFEKTLTYQQQHAQTVLPPSGQIGAERLYNALTTGRWVAMLSITLGLLFFAYSLWLMGRGGKSPRWVLVVGVIYVAVLTAFLILVFVLRWVAGGHVPMAGGFDSMNLMAMAIGVVSLCTVCSHPVALPAGMLTMGFCLLVAMISGSNPPVTHLMPVLSSPLLSLHVAVIMFAYALFFFIMAGSIAGLILRHDKGNAERFMRLNQRLLHPAQLLLAMGIIVGAVWANISWGNYWSWDPKEVWALITFIIYAIPMHPSLLRSPRSFHLFCLLAFLSVIITYFGVNLILGGMHAYS